MVIYFTKNNIGKTSETFSTRVRGNELDRETFQSHWRPFAERHSGAPSQSKIPTLGVNSSDSEQWWSSTFLPAHLVDDAKRIPITSSLVQANTSQDLKDKILLMTTTISSSQVSGKLQTSWSSGESAFAMLSHRNNFSTMMEDEFSIGGTRRELYKSRHLMEDEFPTGGTRRELYKSRHHASSVLPSTDIVSLENQVRSHRYYRPTSSLIMPHFNIEASSVFCSCDQSCRNTMSENKLRCNDSRRSYDKVKKYRSFATYWTNSVEDSGKVPLRSHFQLRDHKNFSQTEIPKAFKNKACSSASVGSPQTLARQSCKILRKLIKNRLGGLPNDCSVEKNLEGPVSINLVLAVAVSRLSESQLLDATARSYFSMIALSNNTQERESAASIETFLITPRKTYEALGDRMLNRQIHEDLCLRAVTMLRSCDYALEDIVCLFGVAAAHIDSVFVKLRVHDILEKVYIGLLQVFLAHSWLFDEACPIKEWHNHIFQAYCSFSCLNGALMKLFRVQDFKLVVSPGNVRDKLIQFLPDNVRQEIAAEMALTILPSIGDSPSTRATLTSNCHFDCLATSMKVAHTTLIRPRSPQAVTGEDSMKRRRVEGDSTLRSPTTSQSFHRFESQHVGYHCHTKGRNNNETDHFEKTGCFPTTKLHGRSCSKSGACTAPPKCIRVQQLLKDQEFLQRTSSYFREDEDDIDVEDLPLVGLPCSAIRHTVGTRHREII